MNEERVVLAKRIREAREYLGFTQQQVSEVLSIPRSAISDIEKGKRRVTTEELKRLANLFQYPVRYFLGEEPELAPDVAALARTAENLSENDRKELLRFAKFLEYQTKRDSSEEGT